MKFTILGIPTPKQSARFRSVKIGDKSFVKSYQKSEIVEKEHNIAYDIKCQLPQGHTPIDGPIGVKVDFVFPPLKSWNKKTQALFTAGVTIYKDSRPDIDNISKVIFDSMNGVVFVDDARIVEYSARKIFGLVPQINIEIYQLWNQ